MQPARRFNVASIKPRDPSVMAMAGVDIPPGGGRLIISGVTLKSLISTAFGLSYWQISGGDAWMGKDEYNVEAIPPEDPRPSLSRKHTWYGIEDERLRQMLQALLADRFQLKFHRETRTGDVYLLQRNNAKPLALKPTDPTRAALMENSAGDIGYAGRWVLSAATMPRLAAFASEYMLHAPVIDQTGLTGPYDYKQPEPPTPEPANTEQVDLFLRLIPELGLRLERTKGPAVIFLIDHATKPSAN